MTDFPTQLHILTEHLVSSPRAGAQGRQISEVPRSPSTPQVLRFPEEFLFNVKAYFERSFQNGTFVTNNFGRIVAVSGNQQATNELFCFYKLCLTGGVLMIAGSCLQGRRLLSEAFGLVKVIVMRPSPHTFHYIADIILYYIDLQLSEIARNLLNYVIEIATYFLDSEYPWRQILVRLGAVEDSDLQPLLATGWSCINNTFQNELGPLHYDCLFLNYRYACVYLDYAASSKMFHNLLERAEHELNALDERLAYLYYTYGDCLYREGRYDEAIISLEKIDTSTDKYAKSIVLESTARCHHKMGIKDEAELEIRKAIKLSMQCREITVSLRCIDTLCGWFREWGRLEEADELQDATMEMTYREGIDDV